MFCPHCCNQNPDGAKFCGNCGATFPESAQPVVNSTPAASAHVSAPSAQPAYSQPAQPAYSQPAQPAYSQPEQPAYSQPAQPVYSQPAQPTYSQPAQPGYAAPMYQQTAVAVKKPVNKKAIIIVSVCGVLLATFLILLFTVIIPNSGERGRLNHTWELKDSGGVSVLDLKHNKFSTYGINVKISWKIPREKCLSYTMSILGYSETQNFVYMLSADGRTLYLDDVDDFDDVDFSDYTSPRDFDDKYIRKD